ERVQRASPNHPDPPTDVVSSRSQATSSTTGNVVGFRGGGRGSVRMRGGRRTFVTADHAVRPTRGRQRRRTPTRGAALPQGWFRDGRRATSSTTGAPAQGDLLNHRSNGVERPHAWGQR